MSSEIKESSIKYLNKDFQSIKRDLIEFTKARHSGSFQDFNESSPGMALLELVAYVGDVLSFYQDMQFEELKQETARQISNVASFAKRLGYRPAGKRAASGIVSVFVEVPATTSGSEIVPDSSYCPTLKAAAKFQGPNGVIFESISDVDFSKQKATENTDNERMVVASQLDSNTGLPTHFAVRKDVQVVAGETYTDTITVGNFEQFLTVELNQEDVIEVLSVTDSDGNDWFQVDYLPQEVLFESYVNTNSDSENVPYAVKLKPVPRRFIVDRDVVTSKTSLIFGSGEGLSYDDELIPNMASFALPASVKNNLTSVAIDPQNFLKTRTLGLSPYNTTLTIKYRVGGGLDTNVPPGSISTVNEAVLDFSTLSLNALTKGEVESSIECINVKKTEGGGLAEDISEIKANSSAFFAAQNRAVTKEDYIARLFSMPQKFGKVEKAFVRRDPINELALDIHVLAKDQNDVLTQASPTLIKNIKTYLTPFRMLTDAVNILQTDIINIKIDFGVVVSSKYNRFEVLTNCLNSLKELFNVDKMQVGQPIILSDLSARLQSIQGVLSVYDIKVKKALSNEDGLSYVDLNNREITSFDIQAHTQSGIIYCPENAIFQVKYPNKDINGESR